MARDRNPRVKVGTLDWPARSRGRGEITRGALISQPKYRAGLFRQKIQWALSPWRKDTPQETESS
jgi:hypothetical protein